MATKPLPDQAYLRECFDYHPLTGALVWRERPAHHFPLGLTHAIQNKSKGKQAACRDKDGYLRVRVGGATVGVHRVIWKWMTGEEPPEQIDHHNNVCGDNRWDNLRAADQLTNGMNQQRRKARSLPKGVSRQGSKFRARIRMVRRQYWLGSYETPEEAHVAYREAAVKHRGEWANTNSEPLPYHS